MLRAIRIVFGSKDLALKPHAAFTRVVITEVWRLMSIKTFFLNGVGYYKSASILFTFLISSPGSFSGFHTYYQL
jgi:hypothetical protein